MTDLAIGLDTLLLGKGLCRSVDQIRSEPNCCNAHVSIFDECPYLELLAGHGFELSERFHICQIRELFALARIMPEGEGFYGHSSIPRAALATTSNRRCLVCPQPAPHPDARGVFASMTATDALFKVISERTGVETKMASKSRKLPPKRIPARHKANPAASGATL